MFYSIFYPNNYITSLNVATNLIYYKFFIELLKNIIIDVTTNRNHFLTTISCAYWQMQTNFEWVLKNAPKLIMMTLNWVCDQLRGRAIRNILIEMKESWMFLSGIGSNKEPKLGRSAKKCKHIFMWIEYVW